MRAPLREVQDARRKAAGVQRGAQHIPRAEHRRIDTGQGWPVWIRRCSARGSMCCAPRSPQRPCAAHPEPRAVARAPAGHAGPAARHQRGPTLAALLTELRGYPGGEAALDAHSGGVVLPLRLQTAAGILSMFTTTTVFGTPIEHAVPVGARSVLPGGRGHCGYIAADGHNYPGGVRDMDIDTSDWQEE